MRLLDSLPWIVLIFLCATLGLAPFTPEPHIVEKLRILVQGTLVQPIDILDLIMHGAPFVVLALKGWRAVQAR
jgi:hypothetical protein